MKTICVGWTSAFEEEFCGFEQKRSLADADLILLEPSIVEFRSQLDVVYPRGVPYLGDASYKFLSAVEHWRREILTALAVGKTVIVFLAEKSEMHVRVGAPHERGKTKIMSNYDLLPLDHLKVTNIQGEAMKLVGSDNVLVKYWQKFGKMSPYLVALEGDDLKELITTPRGERIVGASFGTIVLVPPPEIGEEVYTDYGNFRKSALPLLKELRSDLIDISRRVAANSGAQTPLPDWLSDYNLAAEIQLGKQIETLQERAKDIESEICQLQRAAAVARKSKAVLYETGKPLEKAVIHALEVMGFSPTTIDDEDGEVDLIWEHSGQRFIGEVEGKDTKDINIEKLNQLLRLLADDLKRDNVDEIAEGVLFGNANRLHEPSSRGVGFSEKCIRTAEKNGIRLVRTQDLFYTAAYLEETQDDNYAAQCRNAICSSGSGVVQLPEPPSQTEGES